MRKKLFMLSFLVFLVFGNIACSNNNKDGSTNDTSSTNSVNSSNSLNLTGQVATEIPGTPIDFGTTVTSVLDTDTRKREVFSVSLKAGEKLRVKATSTGIANLKLILHKPGAISVDDYSGVNLCYSWSKSCTETFVAAVAGTYYLEISTQGSGVEYTLTVDIQ